MTCQGGATSIFASCGWEDGGVTIMARIRGVDGSYIQQADFGTISLKVFLEGVLVATLPVTVATSVFDALQTGDPRWTVDSTGYNFLFNVPASAFTTGGKTYRLEFTFTETTGDPYYLVGDHSVQELLSS